jgi:hypothetical protein
MIHGTHEMEQGHPGALDDPVPLLKQGLGAAISAISLGELFLDVLQYLFPVLLSGLLVDRIRVLLLAPVLEGSILRRILECEDDLFETLDLAHVATQEDDHGRVLDDDRWFRLVGHAE